MPILSKSEVQAVLASYSLRIRKAVDAGFKSFIRRLAGAPDRFGRTDAADIFDCVAQALAAEFAEDSAVVLFEGRGTLKLLFDGKVLVRFKKAGRGGFGANLRTRANDSFLDPALPYKDAPQAAKVEICWTVSETGTAFEGLRVFARDGAGVSWAFDLPGSEPLPLFAATPVAAGERPRQSVAKLKGTKNKSERKAS